MSSGECHTPRARRMSPNVLVINALLIAGVVTFTASFLPAAPADEERWDRKYAADAYLYGTEPIPFLKEHIHLLPKGKALDLAMGEGRNGVYLASQGFDVTGLDISKEGLRKARALAARRGVAIETRAVDLEGYQLPADTYALVVCTYYLQRDLFPQIVRALKPGGMAVVETYTRDHLEYAPSFPQKYLLEPRELLRLFDGMTVVRYQEHDTGQSAYASIIVKQSAPTLDPD